VKNVTSKLVNIKTQIKREKEENLTQIQSLMHLIAKETMSLSDVNRSIRSINDANAKRHIRLGTPARFSRLKPRCCR